MRHLILMVVWVGLCRYGPTVTLTCAKVVEKIQILKSSSRFLVMCLNFERIKFEAVKLTISECKIWT